MSLIFKLERDKTKTEVLEVVSLQISIIENLELREKIKRYLVDPILKEAIWDYSLKQEKYPIWMILISEMDDIAILYSEYGFQFNNWGLSRLSVDSIHFGMDSNWFPSLEDAFLESIG